MRSSKIKSLFFLVVLCLVFTSCEKDEDINDQIDIVQAGAAGGGDGGNGRNGGNGGPNGGGPNGGGPNGGGPNGGGPNNGGDDDVARIDNDILEDWTDLMLELDQNCVGMRPTGSARAFAYIFLSAYEAAVPGMDNNRSLENTLQGFNINDNQEPNRIDYEIALNTCLSIVMDHFMLNIPDADRQKIDALEAQKESELSANVSTNLIEDSKAWGSYVAGQVIAYSQTDQAAESQILEPQPLSYVPPTGDGYWTYSADPERALFPYWGDVRTFVISSDQTSSVPPPFDYSEDTSSPYFAEMKEVYDANNDAKAQDGEQLWIAEFWSDDVENLMFGPPARQFSIANQLIDQYNLNLEEALMLYVKLGFSLNDAAVSTWADKYEYMVMRPNVYIHEFIDPSFQTNLFRLVYWPNPSFPGYPSGHSCFASAAGGVFADFFGNNTNFTDRSHEGRTEFRSEPRTFSTFTEMAEENAFSRIPLGVHIRMDCTEGLRLGYEVADAVNDLRLRGNPN